MQSNNYNIMKNISIYIITLLVSAISFAQQDFQGQATYHSKTSADMSRFSNSEMSEERKKKIAERMKSMLEKTYILTFNKTESTYKEEEKLAAPGRSGFGGMMMGSFTAGKQYKNIKTQLFLQDQEFFGKQFLITDVIPKLEWKMTSETKQIGKYTCMKATAMKPVDKMDFSKMRRKKKDEKVKDSTSATSSFMNDIEIPKEVEVTAWYTMQIPVSNGPGEYAGLPGLILEVNEGRTTILCSKITMNPTVKSEIVAPTKGKKVTKEEYSEITLKKIEEMREMYGGKGRKSGMGRR